jgi:hypothetical protein
MIVPVAHQTLMAVVTKALAAFGQDGYPIAPGQQTKLDYLKGADKLVANYVNIYGQDPHHAICARNENGLKAGRFEGKPAGSFSKGHESEIDKWPTIRL